MNLTVALLVTVAPIKKWKSHKIILAYLNSFCYNLFQTNT